MSTLDHAFFYNSQDGDRVYDAESFEYWLKKFFTTGVFAGDLQVTANGDMTVTVNTGYANVDGKVRFFENETTLSLETAGSTYDRIDTVVVERNDSDRDVSVYAITGTYSSNPEATEPIRKDGVYQLVLAQIYVSAGSTSITQSVITDTRTDTDLCGVVTGTVTEYDFDQFAAQFNSWTEEKQAEFLEWFEHMKDQLDEDAAGNLQSEIDNLSTALDNLEVGGRNYLLNTKKLSNNIPSINVNTAKWTYSEDDEYGVWCATGDGSSQLISFVSCINANGNPLEGKKIIFGMDIKSDSLTSHASSYQIFLEIRGSNNKTSWSQVYYKGASLASSGFIAYNQDDYIDGEWFRLVGSFTCPSLSDMTQNTSSEFTYYRYCLRLHINSSNTSETIYVRKPKLELGDIATDWTPAPEDFEDKFDALGYVEVEVPTTGWSSSTPYTQSVTVSGMTSDWIPGNPVLVSYGSSSMDIAAQEAFACVSTITSGTDTLTITCYEDLPEAEFTVRIPGLISA